MTRKFAGSAKAWLAGYGHAVRSGDAEGARRTLDRALAALPPRKHIKVRRGWVTPLAVPEGVGRWYICRASAQSGNTRVGTPCRTPHEYPKQGPAGCCMLVSHATRSNAPVSDAVDRPPVLHAARQR